MKLNKIVLSLVLVCSVNLHAAFLPTIAQPLVALKCVVDLAKLKKDVKDFYKNHINAKAAAAITEDDQSIESVFTLEATASACDILLDTASIMAASYLLYDSFNSSLKAKAA